MEKEIDFKSLSLKEYRDRFGKDLSLDVLKRAYDYSQNGHSPRPALSTSSILYAEPFKQRELFYAGLMAEFEPNAVTIWRLQTETATAQRALLRGLWDYHNRADCIARLGENYACQHLQTLEFPDELIVGVYEHQHRFVAVVSVEAIPESALTVRKVQEVADIVAKNALAYYPLYHAAKERYEWNIKHPQKDFKPEKLPEFREFLLTQPLRFVKGVNPEYDLLCATKRVVSIEEFIVFRSEPLQQKLTIASVDLFGFEHY